MFFKKGDVADSPFFFGTIPGTNADGASSAVSFAGMDCKMIFTDGEIPVFLHLAQFFG